VNWKNKKKAACCQSGLLSFNQPAAKAGKLKEKKWSCLLPKRVASFQSACCQSGWTERIKRKLPAAKVGCTNHPAAKAGGFRMKKNETIGRCMGVKKKEWLVLLVFVGPCFQKGDIHNIMGSMPNRVILLVSECKASKCGAVPWPNHRVHVKFFWSAALNLFELIEKFNGKFRDEKLRPGRKGLVKAFSLVGTLNNLLCAPEFFCLQDHLNWLRNSQMVREIMWCPERSRHHMT
jgi:hypothetical protein